MNLRQSLWRRRSSRRSGLAARRSGRPRSRTASARNPRPRRRSASRAWLTTMPNGTLSSRVTMPPSNFGARASTATAWNPRGSPTGMAPCSSSSASMPPWLYGVPRTMKLSAASPQYSFSQGIFASKPPEATTTVLRRDLLPLAVALDYGREANSPSRIIELTDFGFVAHLDAELLPPWRSRRSSSPCRRRA